MTNNPDAIDKPEAKYVENTTDLFPLASSSKALLQKAIDESRILRGFSIFRSSKIASSGTTKYYSTGLFKAAYFTTSLTAGLAFLITPIWLLQFIHDPVKKLGIITAFIIAFTLLVSVATVKEPYEILTSAAA